MRNTKEEKGIKMTSSQTIYQPSYGPSGEPYAIRARFADRVKVAHYWTEQEAMDARDVAFDAGALTVHVAGLPCRIVLSM